MKRITLSTNDRSYITICHVCLSRDRQLFSVEEYEEIFQNICDNKLLTTLLCWECAAMLRKIKQFKDRAELSTKILKKYLNGQYHKIDSLSNLKICENYAIEIIDQIKCEKTDDDIGDIDIDDIKIEDNVESHNDEHAQNEEQTLKPITNLLLEEIRPQIDIKQELNLDDDGFDDEDNTDNFENNQGNFDEKSPVTCKEADKKKPIKRYRMISNSMNDFKNLVRRVCLNTDEVKSYMVMERLNKLYTDLEFKCSWCAYSWKNENKLVQHNKKYHLKTSGKYQCDFCLSRFARKTNLVLHIRRHFTVFECCECSYRSYRPLMKKHLKGHNRIVECLKCKASFSNIYLFHQHHKDLHVIFVCDICGKKSRSKKILESHISRHYETFECKLCNRTYKTKSTFKRHQEEKHSPASGDDYCVKCDKKFASPSVYRRHIVRSAAHAAERDGDRTAYDHTMADQPGQTMDLTDLLLPSRSIVLTEAQDAAASTSVTPFAEPPTNAAKKSKAQKQREYRRRIAAARTPAQVIAARKADAERQRNFRLRKADNSALVSDTLESTTASSSRSGASSNDVQTGNHPAQYTVQPGTSSDQIEVQQAQSTWNTKWASSIMRFESTFLDNDFGYACSVCDRLWCKNELKPITAAQLEVISEWFIKENRQLCREEYQMVCNSCKRTLNKKTMPLLAKVNGFSYPDQPPGLPPLDPISKRLISPCLPFMQVRRLRHDSSYGIIGQVINVPVDVQEMAKCLPRQLNEDDVINVNIERNLAHNSVYISGYLSKSTISAWLNELQKSPLYRLYEIDVDLSRLHPTVPFLDDIQDDPSNRIEDISAENTPESEILASRQHTMMWHEEDCLNIAPGNQAKPLDIIYDRHAEELSFPSIYFGEPRRFNMKVSLTPDMIATSEIRRRDRRGATPQKILYVAMKILRLRMVNGIYSTFRNVSVTKNVTRRMLEEETEFLKEYVIQNLALMKTVPNSVQYWASRKRDLFAIIRQLGKPTVFLTISANEIHWIKLLTILLKLSKKYPGKTAKDLNTSERCTLVSDDPVTCCVYFYKLVGSLMKMLKSKQTYNPFGKYFVKDYFLRIEFQHQGSPQAHILLWLNDDPRETVSENMPKTIDLVEKISSVARDDVPNNSIYANQIHEHTLTCTKQGETTCRFRVPYWPMDTTRVLVPIPQSDGRRQTLQQKAKELRTSLGERRYACMDDFLNANGMTYVSYLDIVRSTLSRPTLVFRRNFDELMTNTFNPYLAGEVNSNIDIQFILDDYSCAEYVVEYVNKAARGMGDLRRELTTMMQEHPEQDYTGQLKALSIKLLNAVEMSAQEAAWFLLRQPMSETSRHVVYIPTVWPSERQCCRKLRQQMDREGISGDSTDVWTKNIIQRYEERPASLEQVYLAEFASWYANFNDFVDEEDDVHMDDDEDSEAVPEARKSRAPKEYRRRLLGRVIRYRRYDIDETVDYKREMVLLFVQFRNEISEIVDQNKFLQLFDDNKDMIMERRSLFETNLNFENVMKELV